MRMQSIDCFENENQSCELMLEAGLQGCVAGIV